MYRYGKWENSGPRPVGSHGYFIYLNNIIFAGKENQAAGSS